MIAPILCIWTAAGVRPGQHALVPWGAIWGKRAAEQFVAGEHYQVATIEERSINSHNHFFAALNDLYGNLPESIADSFSSVEHLRKRALIATGWRDERSIVCASKAEAQRVAAFVRPMDDFAAVSVHESAVVVWTAKSQSMRAMGKETFQRSKDDVLNWAAALIGTEQPITAMTP